MAMLLVKGLIPAYLVSAGLFMTAACSGPVKTVEESDLQSVEGDSAAYFLERGKMVADSVGSVLKGNLMRAMGEGGPASAVEFCNVNATSLTATLSDSYGLEVKRTTDRLRNPMNAPSPLEQKVIAYFQDEKSKGQALTPKLVLDDMGRKVFFAPIFTAGPCLVCHGNEANMDTDLRERLAELYPNDQAKGYNIDELRGIWSITFKNN
jgi:hypothetical protein